MLGLVILNSTLPHKSKYDNYLKQAELIFCADGGANRALEVDIEPDYVIGDLDSVSNQTKEKLPQDRFIHQPSQYATDLEKTLQFALDKKVTSIRVLGITGNRLDHQICNLNILEKFSNRLEIITIDNYGIGCFVQDKFTFSGEIGQYVSIIAFRKARGVTSKGLKYPLKNATMEWAINDGLSNEIKNNPVEILVGQGALFVYRVLW